IDGNRLRAASSRNTITICSDEDDLSHVGIGSEISSIDTDGYLASLTGSDTSTCRTGSEPGSHDIDGGMPAELAFTSIGNRYDLARGIRQTLRRTEVKAEGCGSHNWRGR